jgi:hypothetical protein
LYLALNEPGSGELKIPMESDLADSVGSGQFAECSYRGAVRGGFFVENISKGQADASEGAGQWVSISGRGALSLLEDAIVWDDGTTATTRDFTDKTKAEILITLIDEAQARGGLGVLSYDFTAALDSVGETWSDSETYKLTVGSSLLDVVRQFARTGIDFDILPSAGAFVLSAYKLGKGTDKSETVYLRTGVNCEEITSDERGDTIKNALRVAYKEGYISVSDAVSIAARRRREKLLDMKMAQTSSSATTIGAAEVELTKDPKKGISVKVYDGAGARAFVDYDLGDYIMLDVRGSETRYRIYGIQPDWAADRYSQVIVELNSILYENDIQMAQDIEWLKDQWVTAHDSDLLEVSYWAALGGTESLITTINDIAVVGQKVFIVGSFTKIGGVATNITIYDIDTGLFTGVTMDGYGGLGGIGYKIFVDGTDVYIVGIFDSINGVTAWGLAKYDGAVWTEVGGGVGIDYIDGNWQGGYAYHIEKIGDWLYIGGDVARVGYHQITPLGIAVGSVARYNIVTDTWEDIGELSSCHGVLFAFGGELYSYVLVGGNHYVKKWVSGKTWSAVGAAFDGAVKSLAVYGTNILAGGSFTGGISEWDGAAWNVFNGGCVGDVLDIAIYLTDVYVVGSFTNIGNRVSKNSGGAWSQLTTGLDNTTNAIALHDSDVYVGGIFTQAGDKAAVKLAIYFTNFEALVDFVESSSNSFDMGAAIHAAQASAITDADEVPFWEDVSNALRKITWANIKAALDLLFVHLTGNETITGTKTFTNTINVGIAPPSAGGNGSVNQTAEGLSAGNIAWTFGNTFASFITGVFSRGTKAAPTAAQSGDVMLKVRGRAYDGAAYGNTSAEIRHVTSEEHAAGAHGTQIELWTTPNTTATMAKALTVQNDGNINIEAGKTYNVNGVPVGGGGVSDGDKGDITVSGSGAAWAIDAKAVTLAKMDDMATAALIYRKTAGAGAPEVNTLATLKTDLGLGTINLSTQQTDTFSPTGWLPSQIWSNAVVSKVTTKLRIVLSASANLSWYWRGVKTDLGATSLTVNSTADAAEGIWYCYSTDGTNFVLNQSPFYIFDLVSGAIRADLMAWEFYWDAVGNTALWIQPEFHASTWNRSVHGWAHESLGTRYSSGLDISFGLTASNADTRVKITSGEIHDEDISAYLTHSATPTAIWEQILGSAGTADANYAALPIYYQLGSIPTWEKTTTSSYPFLPVSNNTIYYNRLNAGSWDYTTSIGSNNFVVYWVVATTNQSEPIVIIPGRLDNANLTAAQAEAFPTISTLFTEFKLLYRIIYRASPSNSNNGKCSIISVTDYRRDAISNNSGATSTPSAALISFTPAAGIASTNVQAAIEEVVADVAATYSTLASMSAANATDLTDAGDTTLHYHAADRNLANSTNPTAASAAFDAAVKTKGDALYQPLDADLTTIAGLTATTDNVIQSVGSSWASRTLAQFLASLPIAAGIYSPTLTAVTNVTAASLSSAFYIRILGFVIGAINASIDPTAGGSTALGIDLPVASNFTGTANCIGNGTMVAAGAGVTAIGSVISDATNDRAEMQFVAADGTNRYWRILFMYQIL